MRSLAVLILAGLAMPVGAVQTMTVVPDATASERLFIPGSPNQSHPGTGTLGGPGGSASAFLAGRPYASASASGSNVRASARAGYFFVVDGPSAFIPMIARVSISASVDLYPRDFFARVSVSSQNNNEVHTIEASAPEDGSGVLTSSYSGDIHFTAWAGDINSIGVSAQASSEGGYGGSAYADPYIFIDPAFAATDPNYASDYALTFSAGAGNDPTGTVPEPATWALMLGGLGLIGSRLRRRRGAAVVAA